MYDPPAEGHEEQVSAPLPAPARALVEAPPSLPLDGEVIPPTSSAPAATTVAPLGSRKDKQTARADVFDYEMVPEDHRAFARTCASSIRLRLKTMAEHAYHMGGELRAMKARLPHGLFLTWLDEAIGMNSRTAERVMQISERLGGKFDSVSNLTLTELYALTAPSTPDWVVQQCVAVGEQGALTGNVMAAMIQHAKQKKAEPLDLPASYALDVLKECLQAREAEFGALLSQPEIKSIGRYLRQLMKNWSGSKIVAQRQPVAAELADDRLRPGNTVTP